MAADSLQTCTVQEIGPLLGKSRTYGYQLQKEGRLVLDERGRVLVEASRQRVAATADPAHKTVADRHARERGEDPAPDEGGEDEGGYNFQRSKAKREHYAAERERTAARKEAGELIEVGEHVAAFSRAGAAIRGTLEAWAAMLPQQLVGRDEAAIRATIADQVESVLRDLAAQIGVQALDAEGDRV